METEDDLNKTTLQTYFYLGKVDKPVGPRDLVQGAILSSPSVAYRNFQKLTDKGLVNKDEYGNYLLKQKIHLKGYIWVGKNLIPSVAILGIVFVGALIGEIAV